jgi:hypothetical protein
MAENTGLPLEAFTKSVPPGWKPGLPKYTFRRWLERLRLWYRTTELSAEQAGPAVAARLQGRVFDTALSLRISLPDGRTIVGDEALAFPGADPVLDPQTGAVTTPRQDTGLQHLLRELTKRHGADDQQQVTGVIDNFVDLRRGKLPLLEYINEHDATYSDAAQLAGFGLNDIGKSHFLMKYAGLPQDRKEHFLMQVQFDLSRYDELKNNLEKFAKSQQPSQLPGPSVYYGDGGDGYDGWYDGGYDDGADQWYQGGADGTWYLDGSDGYTYYENDDGYGNYSQYDVADYSDILYQNGEADGAAEPAGSEAATAADAADAGHDWAWQDDSWDSWDSAAWYQGSADSWPWDASAAQYSPGSTDALAQLPVLDAWWGKKGGGGKRKGGKGKKGKSKGKGKGKYGGGYGKGKGFSFQGKGKFAGFGGKGKGKGKGKSYQGKPGNGTSCTGCGSPNHATDACPWAAKGGGKKGKGSGGYLAGSVGAALSGTLLSVSQSSLLEEGPSVGQDERFDFDDLDQPHFDADADSEAAAPHVPDSVASLLSTR